MKISKMMIAKIARMITKANLNWKQKFTSFILIWIWIFKICLNRLSDRYIPYTSPRGYGERRFS